MFLKSEVDENDPYLVSRTQDEKSALVCLFMQRRHQAGHRGKAATAGTAGIRQYFACRMMSTDFLEAAVVSTARAACLMKPDELRERRDSGQACSVKLPICHSALVELKTRRWTGLGWSDADFLARMLYLGCMLAFELAARIGEYTRKEKGGTDHCYRTDDLTFAVVTASGSVNVAGSALAELPCVKAGQGYGQIAECRVFGVSTKGKISTKAKLIGRRSVAESEFLDDLIEFIVHSGGRGDEELFGFRKQDGSRTVLTARLVRDEMKDIAARNDLPPNYFSAHSLRKGSITHMRAQGVSEDDRRDRGNYAAGSQVMNTTYDYATGLGPLASNNLEGGREPTLTDVKRLIPARRRST
jgi:hypothetical protein